MSEERERFSRIIEEAFAKGLVCTMHACAGWTACECPKKGHNQPPSQAEFAAETATVIGDWLKNHPVIQTEGDARAYKLLRDRGKCCLADMEDERTSRTVDLRTKINDINEEYREPRILLEKVLGEGDNRTNAWIKQEEEKRRKIKEEAWRKVQEAEAGARAAQEREQAAKEEAAVGVETDVLAVSRDAEASQRALERSEREAMRAERNEGVRISGGFRRALGLRTRGSFLITNAAMVVQHIGVSERLLKALEADVRTYFRRYGEYPQGVSRLEDERKVQ